MSIKIIQFYKSDLHNRLKDIIKEEVKTALTERSYKAGGLLDPENFDPNSIACFCASNPGNAGRIAG